MSALQGAEGAGGPFAASLPQGYSSQPVWQLQLGSGGGRCEFNHVYGLPIPGDPRRALDRDLSYWSVTPAETREPWWLTFAHARKLLGARLAFEQFSSVSYMADRIPELLETSLRAR